MLNVISEKIGVKVFHFDVESRFETNNDIDVKNNLTQTHL